MMKLETKERNQYYYEKRDDKKRGWNKSRIAFTLFILSLSITFLNTVTLICVGHKVRKVWCISSNSYMLPSWNITQRIDDISKCPSGITCDLSDVSYETVEKITNCKVYGNYGFFFVICYIILRLYVFLFHIEYSFERKVSFLTTQRAPIFMGFESLGRSWIIPSRITRDLEIKRRKETMDEPASTDIKSANPYICLLSLLSFKQLQNLGHNTQGCEEEETGAHTFVRDEDDERGGRDEITRAREAREKRNREWKTKQTKIRGAEKQVQYQEKSGGRRVCRDERWRFSSRPHHHQVDHFHRLFLCFFSEHFYFWLLSWRRKKYLTCLQ